ncbi:hypothetical protein Dimus_007843, partial [Dionaea muscipula]
AADRFSLRSTRFNSIGLGFTLDSLDVLLLFHAAFSTIQYRVLLKITEEEFSGPPLNVILELILDYMLCMYAGLAVLGNFQSILSDSEEKQAPTEVPEWNNIFKDSTLPLVVNIGC